MNGFDTSRRRPFLLQGCKGPLLAVYFPPAPGVDPRGDVLVVPPFAEEMNRCRAMVTLQALAWAEAGIGTLVLDLYGTGESSGGFVDAEWATWRDDVRRGIAWLAARGNGCAAMLGIRLGAILAAEIACENPSVRRLLFWQPVLNGKQFYTQFLRIRIAAEMEQADGVRSTDELRKLSASGLPVEVSGYEISPALAAALDTVAMQDGHRLAGKHIDWLEVQASPEAAVPRASMKTIADLQAAGVSVLLQSVVGPPFWHVHEREIAPELLRMTTGALDSLRASGDEVAEAPPVPVEDAVSLERPLVFRCGSDELVGVLHGSSSGLQSSRGVVVVVAGGPQYRAGAHRQFVSLARKLASGGYPVLRFDLRGMGDSGGTHRGYQQSEPDIRAAVDALQREQPGVSEVVLLGECESASGILFYAWGDPRIRGAVLVNPWVRTEEGQAQVIIKHYYLDRLRSPEFWKKVRSGDFSVRQSASSLLEVLRAYFRGRRMRSGSVADTQHDISDLPLPQKTAAGLRRFNGNVMLLMSGRDYIAREFDEVTATSQAWAGLLANPRVARRDLAGADHTFSRAEWKNTAADWVLKWLSSW